MSRAQTDFIEGFLAAARFFTEPFADDAGAAPEVAALRESRPRRATLSVDDYLAIPTFIRQGKRIDARGH